MAKKKFIHEFIIDRSKWQRISSCIEDFYSKAHESYCLVDETLLPNVYGSYMHDSRNDRMCCLGFYCKSIGIPEKELSEVGSPFELPKKFQKNILQLLTNINGKKYKNTSFAEDLIDINDDELLSEKLKEKQIAKIFAEKNIKVTFIGPSIKDEIKKSKQRIGLK